MIQDGGDLRQQHLPQRDGATAVSGQVAPQEGHQLVHGEVLQLKVQRAQLI